MHNTAHTPKKRLVAASFAALVALSCTPASAATAAQPHEAAARQPAELKRLPAGRDELVFRGENGARSWQINLSQAEASRIAGFQLAMLNSVVVLPERSWLKVTVNGRTLSTLPVRSPDKATNILVRIPPGVLMAGANTVEMSVALMHRVDCSVTATYELWASLDPAQTGFLVDDGAAYSNHSLEEMAAEPLAEDGATHIHLRMREPVDADAVARAGRLVNALVRRVGLPRPLVDVGSEPGAGAGFDVILSSDAPADVGAEDLRILAREEGITLGRDAATNRLVLVVTAADDAELDSQINALNNGAPKSGAQVARGTLFGQSEFERTFGELGLATDNFAGRHYLASANITLPADFYPATYEKSQLLIDGGHSATLDKNSQLVFRVNGVVAATMTLAAGKAERYEHKPLEVPLRLFHPGQNEVSVEGIASSSLDQQCDIAAMPRESRLTILPSSKLVLPPFARLGTSPQIPSALAALKASGDEGRIQLYLPDLDRDTVGAALSILANTAPAMGPIDTPVVHLNAPAPGDIPGIVIAPYEQLPDGLSAALRRLVAPAAPTQTAAGPDLGTVDSTEAQAARAPADAGFAATFSALLDGGKALSGSGRLLPGMADGGREPIALPTHFLLVGAVNAAPEPTIVGGIQLPQFARDASQWVVVTAPSAEAYRAGIDRLVADGRWPALTGQATSLDIDTGQLTSVQPTRVTYVVPEHFALSDLRPVLGGILSDNIVLSLAGLMLLMSLLGLSTHALIRRMGVR